MSEEHILGFFKGLNVYDEPLQRWAVGLWRVWDVLIVDAGLNSYIMSLLFHLGEHEIGMW